MNINVKQLLIALTAAVVFAQTGVTQLPIDDAYRSIAVFAVGTVAVFLQVLTGGETQMRGLRRDKGK